MKRFHLLPILVFYMLGACAQTDANPELIIDPTESYVEGKWELVKIVGSMIQIVIEGDDLKRKQHYTFTNDGHFSKTTEEDQYKSESTGTYTIGSVTGNFEERYIGVVVLTFLEGDGYAENCSSGEVEKEYLHISKDGQLVNISSAPCDGPYLHYLKLEE